MTRFGFYSRLAWINMKKNRKIYLPFMTIAAAVIMMFYIVFHLNQDPEVTSFRGGTTLQFILGLGVVVISIFSVIFFFYTNSFLMKRRKTELGLYNVLGMGKIHIARVLLWENVFMACFSILAGLAAGILLSKIGQLGLFRLLNMEVTYGFSVNWNVAGITAVIFLAIYALLYLHSLQQIVRSSATELLSSKSVGEREPKSNLLMALAGVILLGAGYVIAQRVTDPMAAIGMFFVAVILVILGTYCCFIAGSVALCKLLRKNKNYYYKTSHFISVSSMIYRMKRNGAGLASICILSTMVLVMLSATACMYIGGEDAVKKSYPRDMSVEMTMDGTDAVTFNNTVNAVQQWTKLVCGESGVDCHAPEAGLLSYRGAQFVVTWQGTQVKASDRMQSDYGDTILTVMPLEDYNTSFHVAEDLQNHQVLVYDSAGAFHEDVLTIFGRDYPVKERIGELNTGLNNMIAGYRQLFVIVPGMQDVMDLYEAVELLDEPEDTYFYSNLLYYMGFDASLEVHGATELQSRLGEIGTLEGMPPEGTEFEAAGEGGSRWISNYFEERNIQPVYELLSIDVQSSLGARETFYSLYGGFFFLGILLSITFLLATVLIMYYKQITEGYEDKERFVILQNVGMSEGEIRKSVNSQVLTVFFAPLVMAGVHIAFAFKMIALMLSSFGITNTPLLLATNAVSFLAFAAFYVVVYVGTSRTYYRLVS